MPPASSHPEVHRLVAAVQGLIHRLLLDGGRVFAVERELALLPSPLTANGSAANAAKVRQRCLCGQLSHAVV